MRSAGPYRLRFTREAAEALAALEGDGNLAKKLAKVRKALGLRSTWFSLSMDAEHILFHQRGYGHGVGMSQAGANAMAAEGGSFDNILAHYYPGTQLASSQP